MTNWEAIIEQHGRAVWQVVYRLLGNHEDAADCFQETFVSALEVSRSRRVRNWAGLLKVLAMRRALDGLRSRVRQKCRSEHVADLSGVPCENPDPAHNMELLELGERLRSALGQLPPRQAEVLCLRYFHQMDDGEIARQAGIKRDSVRVVLHRARMQLRQFLARSERNES